MELLKIEKNESVAYLIFRLTLGVLLLFHGVANTFSGFAFIISVMQGAGLPEFFAYGAFLGEIIAPILIIVGFRARLAGLVLAFNMLIATLTVHTGDIFTLNQFGAWAIELQLFYFLGGIAVFFSGAGSLALSTENNWD